MLKLPYENLTKETLDAIDDATNTEESIQHTYVQLARQRSKRQVICQNGFKETQWTTTAAPLR